MHDREEALNLFTLIHLSHHYDRVIMLQSISTRPGHHSVNNKGIQTEKIGLSILHGLIKDSALHICQETFLMHFLFTLTPLIYIYVYSFSSH